MGNSKTKAERGGRRSKIQEAWGSFQKLSRNRKILEEMGRKNCLIAKVEKAQRGRRNDSAGGNGGEAFPLL